MAKLSFARSNAKLDKTIIFSLPAGHSCPFANLCLAKADKVTGKLSIGQNAKFRCYAASSENLFRVIRDSRWKNFNLLKGKTTEQMVALIDEFISRTRFTNVRIHSSGDFFNQNYFDAWLEIARKYPEKLFYAYTKALPYWVARLGQIPQNFRLTASKGGLYDSLISKHNLVFTEVVFSRTEAKAKGLKIDKDDSLARAATKPFATLLHGTQNSGTPASRAWQEIKKTEGGYKTDYFKFYRKD